MYFTYIIRYQYVWTANYLHTSITTKEALFGYLTKVCYRSLLFKRIIIYQRRQKYPLNCAMDLWSTCYVTFSKVYHLWFNTMHWFIVQVGHFDKYSIIYTLHKSYGNSSSLLGAPQSEKHTVVAHQKHTPVTRNMDVDNRLKTV